jgi:hypothetical protein
MSSGPTVTRVKFWLSFGWSMETYMAVSLRRI